VSPVLAPSADDAGRSFGNVRVSVAVFATSDRADAALDGATSVGQRECVRAAVYSYLATRDPADWDPVPPAAIDAFLTEGGPVVGRTSRSRALASTRTSSADSTTHMTS
jgi:hypothetical protein